MKFVDTHSHIYLSNYDDDRDVVISDAVKTGTDAILLPAIDSKSHKRLLDCCNEFPGVCYPMMGIHPTSVDPKSIDKELDIFYDLLDKTKFYAIGEIGIDLYWDKTHAQLQEDVFRKMLDIAVDKNLPVSVHIRNSFNEVWRILKKEYNGKVTGVLHCFPGNTIQAKEVIEHGFYLGIGGVVTFNNSNMQKVITDLGIDNIVLETDAPYLTPAPYRGKRNSPEYIKIIAQKIADITSMPLEKVAEVTTNNAFKLFNINTQ